MLEPVQEVRPQRVGVVLGTGEIQFFATDRFWFHYQKLKQDFLTYQAVFDPHQLPHPGRYRSYGHRQASPIASSRSAITCSRVAHITSGQIKKLEAAGITTMTGLAGTTLQSVRRMPDAVFSRAKRQAALQVDSADTERPKFVVLRPEPDMPRRGLALLPRASEGDVFFDLEGFPLVDGGLEYLFGAVVLEREEAVFRDWWAHDTPRRRRLSKPRSTFCTIAGDDIPTCTCTTTRRTK